MTETTRDEYDRILANYPRIATLDAVVRCLAANPPATGPMCAGCLENAILKPLAEEVFYPELSRAVTHVWVKLLAVADPRLGHGYPGRKASTDGQHCAPARYVDGDLPTYVAWLQGDAANLREIEEHGWVEWDNPDDEGRTFEQIWDHVAGGGMPACPDCMDGLARGDHVPGRARN